MYNWFTLLYTWKQHKIINQLKSNKIKNQKNVKQTKKKKLTLEAEETEF